MARLSTILDQIDTGAMLLPEFQRGYVWNRDQVRGLMRSLYHGYPVGALLVWETDGVVGGTRGAGEVAPGTKNLLLDGQQRLTTLYGVIRGRPPSFFEGDPTIFSGLHFNVETEAFHFLAPVTAQRDPLWVDVTALFNADPDTQYDQLLDQPWMRPSLSLYLKRLLQLEGLLQREFYVDRVTGSDRTVDQVVDIFNRLNSGGTKLSKGDLALAQICAGWPDARPAMRRALENWRGRRYNFSADWLLRNVCAVATGRAAFSVLENVSTEEFRTALGQATQNVDHFLDLIAGRLGLDHDRVISGARYAIPVVSRLLHQGQGKFVNGGEADRALYWFVHAGLRGRFAGSTETVLAKDLETADRAGVDGLIETLRRSRQGTLSVAPEDLDGLGKGSRAYPLLYLLTRVTPGHDLATTRPLDQDGSTMQSQGIFPKDALYRAGYNRAEVNAVANLAFATPATAASFAKRLPTEYLGHCAPEALASQYIPTDPSLWTIENYGRFLQARRELLAAAADDYLDRLLRGQVEWSPALQPLVLADETDTADARVAQIKALVDELVTAGHTHPQLDTEIADPESGRSLAVAEVLWSEGLQAGQGKPVVLELDPEEADLSRLAELGYEVFTSVDALRGFAQRRNEIASGDRDDEGTGAPDPESSPVPPPAVVAASRRSEQPAEPARPADEKDDAAAAALDARLSEIVETCRSELKYHARPLVSQMSQYGGVGAVKRMVEARVASDVFVLLWERERLELSVEALVHEARFASLFTDDERELARRRLEDFGYSSAA